MAIRKRTSPSDGTSSFYGMYRHSRTTLAPNIGIKAPINDLCMPHIVPNGAAADQAYLRQKEKQKA